MSTKESTPTPTTTIHLSPVDPTAYNVAVDLMDKYKITLIREIAAPLVATLSTCTYLYTDQKGKTSEPSVFKGISKDPSKDNYTHFFAYFLCNENIEYFLNVLPANTRALWHAVAKSTYINIATADTLWGKKCLNGRHWMKVDEALSLFFVDNSPYYYYGKDFEYLSFSHQLFYEAMFCLQLKKQAAVTKLPKNLTVFEGEIPFLNDFLIVEALHLGKKYKLGKTKPRTISVFKAVRGTDIKEFFTKENIPNEESEVMRGVNLAIMYDLIADSSPKKLKVVDCEPEDWSKLVVSTLISNDDLAYAILLSYISGFRRNTLDTGYMFKLYESVDDAFKDYDKLCNVSQAWLPIEKLYYAIKLNLYNQPKNRNLPFPISINGANNPPINECIQKYVTFDENDTHIVYPAIKGICFLLASWGILDIAYETQLQTGAVSPYDGLKYVRLTKLGRYAFGLDKKYTSPINSNEAKGPIFEMDSERLLIKLLDPESPKRLSLDRFATAVTPNLYRVDTKSFLKECEDKFTLEEKILSFQHIMGSEFSPIWIDFFDTLKQQCQPLEKAGKAYTIRRISKDNKRLQEIIMTDEKLKQYIVRAENYLILIENKNMDEVTHILRNYGYIL